jgi:signal transduction histidine kinase
MLGEQLIKNEQIALAELIKNAYDADADWVKISFNNFGENMKILPESKIIIEDNGIGMDLQTIQNSWMNPATSNKKVDIGKENISEYKKRVIQGEKGIGRFAILKLGRVIEVTTRPINTNYTYKINYDFSLYDDEFLTENGVKKELFLDEIDVRFDSIDDYKYKAKDVKVNYKTFRSDKNIQGTKIEITNLKGEWSDNKIEDVNKECQKLESIFDKIFNKNLNNNFEVGFEKDGERLSIIEDTIEKFKGYLDNSAVLKVTDGKYNENTQIFSYKINDISYELNLNDPRISGSNVYKKHFSLSKDLFNNTLYKKSTCGNFRFNFFVFDFAAKKESKFHLGRIEKNFIKEHRIYLYRDKIRVAPYGDPDNDWIGTDKERATSRAADYLSNDQVVGFVEITKKNNPYLKDKTNREGLIEEGSSTIDFIKLLQTFLFYLTQHPYKQYKISLKLKEEQNTKNKQIVSNKFESLEENIQGNSKALAAYKEVINAYNIEKKYYSNRLEQTEDLAGVGLSVETASHDIMLMLSKGINALDDLVKDVDNNNIGKNELLEELLKIRGIISFVESQMKDIQLLFTSSKRRRKQIRVIEILDKVVRIYKRTLKREHIELVINTIGNPLIVSCTDAVLLQLFINLFDNGVYWLSVINQTNKLITITLDGNNKQLIFSDNGAGVHPEDVPYIFEAFYSGKEEGRGLGLYIAKQLLNRLNYSIELTNHKSEKILPGANFVVNFIKDDKND